MYEFHRISSFGEPEGPSAPRMFGFWNVPEDVVRRLCVEASSDWPVDATITLEPGSPEEDAAFVATEAIPVSDRLRQWMEERCPDQVMFLPVRIAGAEVRQRYWVMTPTRFVDCLDKQRTVDWMTFVVDESRVAPALEIFRAVGDVQCSILVRDRLRKAMEIVGFSGLEFIPVQHTSLVEHRWRRKRRRSE